MSLDRQVALEAAMTGDSRSSFFLRVEKAAYRGQATTEKPGHSLLMQVVIEPFIQAMVEWLADAHRGIAGRHSLAARDLSQLKPEVVAFLTAKSVIDGITLPDRSLTAVALAIGAALEGEINAAQLRKALPGFYRTVKKDLDSRTSNATHKRRTFRGVAQKRNIDVLTWEKSRKLHAGTACVILLSESTGLVHLRRKRLNRGVKTTIVVEPTELALEILDGKHGLGAMNTPAFLPMVMPPRPWEGIKGGGYLGLPAEVPLVKTHEEHLQKSLGGKDLGPILEALNHIQGTAWRINTRVLEVFEEVWRLGLPIGKLPPRDNLPLPPKPADIDTNKEARRAWRTAATAVHNANVKLISKRIQTERIRAIANDLKDDPEIFFPHNFDFRGRAYALPLFLQPQGSDLPKGLLHFAKGVQIDDERALGWLFVHGANCFGYDKDSLEGRVAWCEERLKEIAAAGRAPLDVRWWMQADSPFMFLAFCMEVADLIEHGWGYESHLPVMLDASCSGIQNFSAMLRDEIGGAAVNLVPADKPQDIYQRVADKTIELLRSEVEGGGEGATMAQQWLDYGLTRKATKRPTMTLPYGAKQYSCRKYLEEHVRENAADGKPHPWGDQLFAATLFLSRFVWEAQSQVVVAARQAMDWLQACAAVATGKGLTLSWTTPDGFTVIQPYRDQREQRIDTLCAGRMFRLSLKHDGEKVDPRRSVNAVAPNFVHSLDGNALRAWVLEAKAAGIDSVAVVHDSFGTHAGNTDASVQLIQKSFVEMYLDNDVLQQFFDSLPEEVQQECPPMPEKGNLDLEQTLQSDYFFS